MRLSVHHTETLTYATPSMGTIQVLRLTPRDHTGHYVCEWSVDVDADCKIENSKDPFGNILTSFSLGGPIEALTITAVGEVETEETHGIVRGAPDHMPHGVFLRPSHAESDAALIRTAINAIADVTGPELGQMHALMAVLHAAQPESGEDQDEGDEKHLQNRAPAQAQMGGDQAMQQQTAGDGEEAAVKSPASKRLQAMLAERGVLSASEIAELFCNTARRLGLPARLISGYRWPGENKTNKEARDIWAEALIDDLGWVAFDPHLGNCPSEDSVRAAVGLDRHAVASTRVGHYGGMTDVERTTSIAVRRIGG